MIQTYLDKWVPVKAKHSKREGGENFNARPARMIKLAPAGFPIRELHRNYPINIEKEDLFELYAKEQWIGSIVKIGDYLFDQRVIPDFAFQIKSALPTGNVKIVENTIIKLDWSEVKSAPEVSHKTLLNDVVGHSNVKRKCKIVIKYLEEPETFGDWAPKNVLFYGTPGTGKTMTARALANEVNATFMMVRATDLVGEYVGDGSKRIHELYSRALETAPTVIFIDELDAIALDRSFQHVRGDVSEVVNALLSELDGIKTNQGIVTVAATNNPIQLDHAIRSRFEEELEFKLPNKVERKKIMENASKSLPIQLKADLDAFVKKTKGFSGRDLKEKVLKAGLYKAILDESNSISDKHIEEALSEIKTSISHPPKEMFR